MLSAEDVSAMGENRKLQSSVGNRSPRINTVISTKTEQAEKSCCLEKLVASIKKQFWVSNPHRKLVSRNVLMYFIHFYIEICDNRKFFFCKTGREFGAFEIQENKYKEIFLFCLLWGTALSNLFPTAK